MTILLRVRQRSQATVAPLPPAHSLSSSSVAFAGCDVLGSIPLLVELHVSSAYVKVFFYVQQLCCQRLPVGSGLGS